MKNPFPKLLLLVILASLLTSCSGAAPWAPTPEPITLKFAYIGAKDDYKSLADQFHASNPAITIELQAINGDRYEEGYNQLRDAFKDADVVRANISYLDADHLSAVRPLDDFLLNPKGFTRDDFFPGLLDAMKYKGTQVGLPAGIDPVVMFYENLFFKIAKANPPTAGYTLDDFIASATLVNHQSNEDKANGKFSYGFCTSPTNMDPVVFLMLMGGNIFDNLKNPTRPTLNDPASVEAADWYSRLWIDYQLAPPVSDESYGAYRYVYQNLCGFWIQYYDMSGFMRGHTLEARMLPLPKASQPFNYASWDAYFLTKASNRSNEAWEWMSFLAQHQEASSVQIPPLSSQIASDEFAKRVSPDALAIARGLKHDLQFATLDEIGQPLQNQVGALYLQAIKDVIAGKSDVQSALDDAQRQAEDIFASRQSP